MHADRNTLHPYPIVQAFVYLIWEKLYCRLCDYFVSSIKYFHFPIFLSFTEHFIAAMLLAKSDILNIVKVSRSIKTMVI